jgi:hypothetical protein
MTERMSGQRSLADLINAASQQTSGINLHDLKISLQRSHGSVPQMQSCRDFAIQGTNAAAVLKVPTGRRRGVSRLWFSLALPIARIGPSRTKMQPSLEKALRYKEILKA